MNNQKISLNIFAFILLCTLFLFSNLAIAHATSSKESLHLETCKNFWEDLWPKAQKGDIEARFNILVSLAPPPDMTPFLFPGNGGDYASQYRDILIWGIYNSDYFLKAKEENSLVKTYRKIIFEYVAAIARSPASAAASYLNCVNENKKGCDAQAVKNGLVPPFSDFVKNVDESVQMKKYGTCKEYFTKK